ncbi:MAG: hypothetical protein ACXABY_34990, partial [Candidatus Thorarchaeota archaeon]
GKMSRGARSITPETAIEDHEQRIEHKTAQNQEQTSHNVGGALYIHLTDLLPGRVQRMNSARQCA